MHCNYYGKLSDHTVTEPAFCELMQFFNCINRSKFTRLSWTWQQYFFSNEGHWNIYLAYLNSDADFSVSAPTHSYLLISILMDQQVLAFYILCMSSGLWHRVTGQVLHCVLRDCCAFIFSVEELNSVLELLESEVQQSFKMSVITLPIK